MINQNKQILISFLFGLVKFRSLKSSIFNMQSDTLKFFCNLCILKMRTKIDRDLKKYIAVIAEISSNKKLRCNFINKS